MNELIEMAIKALQPITYEPHHVGYFVMMNDKDNGGSDYCENCIKGAVKEARKYHRERRQEIIEKHAKALASGKYSAQQVAKSQRQQLKEYPAKASFSYEGHDPDFGGGAKEPHTCEGCGEAFFTEFTADVDETEHLLRSAKAGNISERDKWEMEMALYHYEYAEPKAQEILIEVANKILNP